MKALRQLAWVAAVLTAGLIVLGGVVRITGSGMGCGDHWPRCNGEWFPPLDLPTFIEIFHRWIAGLVSIAVVALAWLAWRRHRHQGELLHPALLALLLLVAQVLLGAVTVKLELPPAVVIVHFLNAMVLLAVVTLVALRAGAGQAVPPLPPGDRHTAHAAVVAIAALGFVTVFFGGQTANLNGSFACMGFPFCGEGLAPPAGTPGLLHWTHRILAFLMTFALGWLVWRLRRAGPPLRRATWGTLAAALLQVVIGAAMILALLPTSLRAAHLAGGTLVWVALVVLLFRSARERAEKA